MNDVAQRIANLVEIAEHATGCRRSTRLHNSHLSVAIARDGSGQSYHRGTALYATRIGI